MFDIFKKLEGLRPAAPTGPVEAIVAGLGNPGREYENTRHNAGFLVLDQIAGSCGVRLDRLKYKSLCADAVLGGRRVLLMKPQTFMNLSGESIRDAVDFYKIDPETELIVIYDDIDLEPGQLRIRKQGSAGGHNGIKDIIRQLGTEKFLRIKVGVGAKPKGWDLADHVLGRFGSNERKLVEEAQERACKAVEMILADSVDAAMNQFNKKMENV